MDRVLILLFVISFLFDHGLTAVGTVTASIRDLTIYIAVENREGFIQLKNTLRPLEKVQQKQRSPHDVFISLTAKHS